MYINVQSITNCPYLWFVNGRELIILVLTERQRSEMNKRKIFAISYLSKKILKYFKY